MKYIFIYLLILLGLNLQARTKSNVELKDSLFIKSHCDTNIITINYKSTVVSFNLSSEKELLVNYLKKTIEIDKSTYTVLNNSELIIDLLKNNKVDLIEFGILNYDKLKVKLKIFDNINSEIKFGLDSLFYYSKENALKSDYKLALKTLQSYDYINLNNVLESIKNKFEIKKQSELIFLKALNSFNHFKYDSALNQIQLALSIDSTNFDCNVLKAQLFSKLNRFDSAIYQMQISNNLTNDNKNKSSVLFFIGSYYLKIKSYTKALDSYFLALNYASKVYESNDTNLAIIYNDISYLYSLMGNYTEAINYSEKVYNSYKLAYSENDNNLVTKINSLGIFYQKNRQFDSSIICYTQSLNINESIYGKNSLAVAQSLSDIAAVYFDMKSFKLAVDCYKKSLAIRIKVLGNNNIIVGSNFNDLGVALNELDSINDAIKCYSEAIKIFKNIYPCSSIKFAVTLSNLGLVERKKKNCNQALKIYEYSFLQFRNCNDTNSVNIAYAFNNIAGVYNCLENYDTAISLYTLAISIFEKENKFYTLNIANLLLNQSFALTKKGDYKNSLESCEKAIRLVNNYLGSESFESKKFQIALGIAYIDVGKYSKAIECFENSNEFFKKDFSKNADYIYENNYFIGTALIRSGNLNEGLEMLEKSAFFKKDVGEKAKSLNRIGFNLYKKSEYNSAINYYLLTIKILENETDPNIRSLLPKTYYNLGKCYCALGEKENAVKSYNKSIILYQNLDGDKYTESIKKELEACK